MNILDVTLPQAKNRNDQIKIIANRVYTFAGQDCYLIPTHQAQQDMVKVSLQALGQSAHVYLSLTMVNTYLQPFALQLEQMSADAIHLFLLHQAEKMPQNLQITKLEMVTPPDLDYFQFVSYQDSNTLPWYLGITETKSLALLVQAMSGFCKGVMQAPLASLPIPLPLVATSLQITPTDLFDLEVGDILLLENL